MTEPEPTTAERLGLTPQHHILCGTSIFLPCDCGLDHLKRELAEARAEVKRLRDVLLALHQAGVVAWRHGHPSAGGQCRACNALMQMNAALAGKEQP